MRRSCAAVLAATGIAALAGAACSEDTPGNSSLPAAGGAPGAAGASGIGGTSRDAEPDTQDARADVFMDLDASGVVPEARWLVDPEAWELVSDVNFAEPACQFFEAVPGELRFPPLEWRSDCGPGCELADLVLYEADARGNRVASTHVVDGFTRTYVNVHHTFVFGEILVVTLRHIRLSDSITIGAIQTRWNQNPDQYCVVGGARESSRNVVLSGGGIKSQNIPSQTIELAAPRRPGEKWIWRRPALTHAEHDLGRWLLDIDDSDILIQTGLFTAWATLTPESSELTQLDTEGALEPTGVGEGDLAIWSDAQSTAQRLRGWSPDGAGVRTLLESIPSPTCGVAISPTRFVGFHGRGGPSCNEASEGYLWVAPRSKATSSAPPQISPVLPGTPYILQGASLKTWGDYAVARFWPDSFRDVQFYLVVQLSTWKVWRVDPRDAAHEFDWWGHTLDDEYLYFDEVSRDDGGKHYRMVRLRLSELDQSATVLQLP